jgi:NitT/TauT family transport system ATP-binding protein
MSASAEAIVSLRGVSKTFDSGTVALRDFDFSVRAGEFVSLLGPSGCGKSTVLRIISGLSEASAGTVTRPGGAAQIGFVFQESTLMPWASVAANVHLPFTLARADNAKSATAVTQALERVGLAEFANSYPRELSGGMKMRASIARALVTGPQLLLMDEPFAALDALTRVRMQDELLALWDEICFTVLFVTHSIPEAIKIGSRILLLSPHPGQVKAEINSVARGQENSNEAAALGREIHDMLFADQIEEAPHA